MGGRCMTLSHDLAQRADTEYWDEDFPNFK